MYPDDQPTIPTAPPSGSRSNTSGVWVAPSVEELQAKLPQYEVLEILGRGGMGAVYKARQKSLKRLVAIKILPLGMADDEFKFVERFQNEAQTMAQMNHPAIVAVHDFGETSDGLLYFVMEFVDGTDVHKMIQASGRLSGEYALAITAHVCDALSYAHKRGVIHRDIKPANILIDQEGHVKVADFGLAKMDDPAQTSGLTRTNMAMGTPDYVAPEVLVTGMVADHRADIYAVGVMLYQMLTGEVPRGLFKMPSRKGIGCDERFDAIICKAMEHDREERYQSAMDVRRALDVILTTPQAKNEGTGVVPVKDLPQKPAAAPVTAPVKKQRPAALWLFIGGIAAVLVVGGWMAFVGMGKTDAAKADMQPVDAAFLAEVAAASPEEQVKLVATRIEALNKVPVLLKPEITSGRVNKLTIARRGSDLPVSDLSPVTALPGLKDLTILTPGLRDLAWLRGTTLATFSVHAKNEIMDLKVLRELSLTHLALQVSPPRDYSALSGLPLRGLNLSGSPLHDLSFVKGMPLGSLSITGTGVTDLSPLTGLPLQDLTADLVPERDAEILRAIPTLTKINGKPAAEFLASIGTKAKSVVATAARTVDLLPLVDVKRDTVAGEWSRDGGDLLVKAARPDAKGNPRLQLPYQPPEEYDFEIEFTPESGTNMVGQILSAYEHSFAWFLDAQLTAGSKAGFNAIDGVSVASRTDGTTMRERFLTNGLRHRSTIEVRRNRVRALLDGEPLVTWGASPKSYERLEAWRGEKLRDALHLGLITYDRGVRFHKATVREITGTGKVDATTTAAPINWLNNAIWEKPWVLDKGVLKSTAKETMNLIGTIGDGTIRVRLRDAGTSVTSGEPPLQFKVRVTELTAGRWGNYQLQIYPQKNTCSLLYMEINLTTGVELPPTTLWKDKPLSAAPAGGKDIEFEFRAEGDGLSVWAADQLVASIRDPRLSKGGFRIIANPTIEITRLETVGVTNSKLVGASFAPPTNITTWQDVTGTVMEQAKTKPGFTIEGGLIAWTGDKGNPPRIDVTPAGRNDYAIRLKHVEAGQINVRFNEKGFIYVQSAPSGLRINRWMKGVVAPVALSATQEIPFSYSKGEPHDLTVTVQGSTIRAWLDGQLMGTVEDATFADGTGAIAVVSYGKVQKVEIAELGTTASSAAWTDWLGPKLARGQSPIDGWKIEGGGVIGEKPISGTNVLAHEVKDATVRVSYDLRDSKGIQITMRENKPGGSRDLYFVDDTGDTLYLARLQGVTVKSFERRNYPVGTPRTGTRTLEFRCVGDHLEATLTGATSEAITLTATDATLPSGPCAVVLKQGVLLKKVEVRAGG